MDLPDCPPGAEGYQDSVTEVPKKPDDPSCTKAEHEFQEHLNSLKIKLEDGSTRAMVERSGRDISGKWIYLCYPCAAVCSGESILQTHISGKKHKSKLALNNVWPKSIFDEHPYHQNTVKTVATEKILQKMAQEVDMHNQNTSELDTMFGKYKNEPCRLQELLDGVKTALVGLEYLIEHDPEQPHYSSKFICTLCSKQGQPRTIINHMTGFGHRWQYILRHFPKAYHLLMPYRSQPKYREGVGVVISRLIQRIEDKYGRKRPLHIDTEDYEKDKDLIHQWIYKDHHFAEKEGCTFEEVVDIGLIESLQQTESRGQAAARKEKEPSPPVVPAPSKIHFNSFSRPPNRQERRAGSAESLSDISDDMDTEARKLEPAATDRQSRDKGDRRGSSPYRSRYAIKSNVPASKYQDKTRAPNYEYKLKLVSDKRSAAEEFARKTLAYHEKNPEKHPLYPEEWKKFWNRRYKEIQAEGKDPSKHDFKPEWILFWTARMKELHDKELRVTVNEIYRKMCLTPPDMTRKSEEPAQAPEPPRRRRPPQQLRRQSPPDKRARGSPPRAPSPRRRSPDKRLRSPDRRLRSPDKRLRSPDKRLRSPDKRLRSPDKRLRSPDKRLRSPDKRLRSPDKRLRSPDNRLPLPENRLRSPEARRRELEHRRREPPPRRRSSELRHREPPRRRSPDVRRDRRSPAVHRSPGRAIIERQRSPVSHRLRSRSRSPIHRGGSRRSCSPLSARAAQPRNRSPEHERALAPSMQTVLISDDELKPEDDLSPWNSDNDIASVESMRTRSSVRSGRRAGGGGAGSGGGERRAPDPSAPDDVVATLRLLVALEDYLGSLGPKLVDLLGEALKMEKEKPNSSEELLDRETAVVLMETAKEKLKGAAQAGLVTGSAAAAARAAVVRAAATLHEADKRAKSKQTSTSKAASKTALPVAGVGEVDRAQIAQQMAEALIAQGKTDVSSEELAQLVEAVVGMAEAKKREAERKQPEARPAAQAPPPPVASSKANGTASALQMLQSAYDENDKKIEKDDASDAMDGLSDSDLETLLKNFNELSAEEQHSLIAYLKKLEAREPTRVERLRQYVSDAAHAPAPAPAPASAPACARASRPPAAPADAPVTLDSDDDDYTVEEVFQSATQKVKEDQMRQEMEIVKKSLEEVPLSSTEPEAQATPATTSIISNIVEVTRNLSSASDLFALVQASIKSTPAPTPAPIVQPPEVVASSTQPRSFGDLPDSPMVSTEPAKPTVSPVSLMSLLPPMNNQQAPLSRAPANFMNNRNKQSSPHDQFQTNQQQNDRFNQGNQSVNDCFNHGDQQPNERFNQPPTDWFNQGNQPPNDRFSQAQPPNDHFVQGQPPNDRFNQGQSPNDRFIQGQPPNDRFNQGQPLNDRFMQGNQPSNDRFNQGIQPSNDSFNKSNQPNDRFNQIIQPSNDRFNQAIHVIPAANEQYHQGVQQPNERVNQNQNQGNQWNRQNVNLDNRPPQSRPLIANQASLLGDFNSGQYNQGPRPNFMNPRGLDNIRPNNQQFGNNYDQNNFRGRGGRGNRPARGRGRGYY